MEFQSEQAAYEFHNRYAFRVGFAIRGSWKHNLKNSTELKDRMFCCTRQGVRLNNKRDEKVVNVSAETRCDCLARMKIILNNGVYRVYEFIPEHNHRLTTSEQTHRLSLHRNMSNTQLNQVELARSGHRRGDEYLATRVAEDVRFFHSVQPDEDDLITNIFWADAKMRIDYEDFGDVTCFDTTYKKLNDGRPFGLLVGLWWRKKSKTILTDEDAAMASAIKTVLPEVHHRICVWHMYQNALKHLSGVFKEFKKFSFDFGNCVYEHENEAHSIYFKSEWSPHSERIRLLAAPTADDSDNRRFGLDNFSPTNLHLVKGPPKKRNNQKTNLKTDTTQCILCLNAEESLIHLFRECSYTTLLVVAQMGLNSDVITILKGQGQFKLKEKSRAIAFEIWKERCRTFQDSQMAMQQVINSINSKMHLWTKCYY
ncbi:hypothetical protein LUZ60_013007 [Juncus effusus]|nr:hypothetical protein LUZ60_013007 [Juncus effusus]